MVHELEHLEGYQKFQQILNELFQFELADLDFGLYRVLKQRRQAIEDYFAKGLPQRLQQHLNALSQASKATLEADLEKTSTQLRALVPTALDVEGKLTPMADTLASAGGQIGNLIGQIRQVQETLEQQVLAENQINDVLLLLKDFFERYYQDGDFIPQPRFSTGEGYALESYTDQVLAPQPQDFPGEAYRGEDVYFHWPTRGMHYAKSDTYLKNYSFTVQTQGLQPQTFTVQFVLARVESVSDNNKAARFFVPKPEVKLEASTLTIAFDYRRKQEGDAANQEKILEATLPAVLANIPDPDLRAALEHTGDNHKSFLARRARHFSALGSKDFFIHPHLERFLSAELDYFTKAQALRHAEFDNDYVLRRRVATLKAFKSVATDLIRFLAQLEGLQAKLFEKKRLVYRADYIVPIRHIPKTLWPEILGNQAQANYWKQDLGLQATTEATLETHPSLPVYTGHFDPAFSRRLLAALSEEWDLDEATDGLLVHADNYGALRTLGAKYREQVKVIYIDPPYNTAASEIPYKNGFKHSTFASLIEGRTKPARDFLPRDGVMFVSIDKHERTTIEHVLSSTFGSWNRVEEAIWVMNTTNSQVPTYSTNHEYVLVWAKDLPTVSADPNMFREPKPGYEEVMELVTELNPQYPLITDIEEAIKKLYKQHEAEYRQWVEAQGLELKEEKKNDPWKGIFPYKYAEYRDAQGQVIPSEKAKELAAKILVWRESDISMPSGKQAESTRISGDPNYRFYNPTHPKTGKPCPRPKSGWKFAYEDFVRLDIDSRIVWGDEDTKVPQLKRFLHEAESNVGKSVVVDYNDGEKETSALFGRSGVFFAPKPTSLVARFVRQTTRKEGIVMDYFGGSGTTAHAVVALNREDKGHRKFILVEMGNHFDTVIVRRIQKVMYAPLWSDGMPKPQPGLEAKNIQPTLESSSTISTLPDWMNHSPRMVKVIRLESYEDALYNLQGEIGEREGAYQASQSAMERPHEFLKTENAYLLSYFGEVLQDGNPALLRPVLGGQVLAEWNNPEAIQLKRPQSGAAVGFDLQSVDWLETAVYWLGLKVQKYAELQANGRSYRVMWATPVQDGQPVALLLRHRTPDLDVHAERQWLEQTFPEHRVIINAPPIAAFESLEGVLFEAMMEGPK